MLQVCFLMIRQKDSDNRLNLLINIKYGNHNSVDNARVLFTAVTVRYLVRS